MSLNPRPARYAEARVARLNRKSALNRLPPTQFLPCGTSLGEALGLPREQLIVIGQSEHYHPTLGIACFTCQRAHFIRTNPPALQVVQEVVGDIHEASRLPDALSALQSITDGNRPRPRICPGSTVFYLLRTLPCIFASNRCLKSLLPNEARFARHVAHSLSHPVAWCSGRRRAAPASIRLGCVRPGRKSDRRSADHREVHRQGNEKGGPEAQDAGR